MASSWVQEAQDTAKKYAEALKQQSQYLIEQQNQAKQNTLDTIEKERLNAINNLNAGKDTVRQEALDNAKQANINRMLALKDNQGAMSRAGLSTQGILGSQVNSINNNYGSNLNSIIRDRTNQLKSINDQVNSTNLEYDANRLNAINQYDANVADLQSQIDDRALAQYNTIYQQALAQKQQEWQNQLAELERQEAIRQYNLNLALQQSQLDFEKQQAAQSQKNWEKEYALNKSQSLDFNNPFSPTSKDYGTASNGRTIIANPYTNTVNEDAKYGVFSYNGTTSGYQPNNVGGAKLSKTGKNVTQLLGTTGNQGATGINIDKQNVWTANNKYYVWDGSLNKYVDITSRVTPTNRKVNGVSVGSGKSW